jgi:hypothetical protein
MGVMLHPQGAICTSLFKDFRTYNLGQNLQHQKAAEVVAIFKSS